LTQVGKNVLINKTHMHTKQSRNSEDWPDRDKYMSNYVYAGQMIWDVKPALQCKISHLCQHLFHWFLMSS